MILKSTSDFNIFHGKLMLCHEDTKAQNESRITRIFTDSSNEDTKAPKTLVSPPQVDKWLSGERDDGRGTREGGEIRNAKHDPPERRRTRIRNPQDGWRHKFKRQMLK